MSNYRTYSPEEKIAIVKEYLSGKASLKEIGSRYGYICSNGYPRCVNIHSVIRKKKYLYSTPQTIADNVLRRDFYASVPNQKWANDV